MLINPYKIVNNNEEEGVKNKKVNSLNNTYESIKNIISKLSEQIIIEYPELIEKNKTDVIGEKINEKLIEGYNYVSDIEKENIKTEIINKIFGYGILQKYLDDKNVTDIRVVRYNKIYIKKCGKWQKVFDEFKSEEEFESYIRFCAIKNNSVINIEKPIAIFSDRKNALRIEAGILPANVDSPSLVIRIHNKDMNMTLEELLLKTDMLNASMYKYLKDQISDLKSIVICGKGGSGKTTLLKAILNAIPENVSITTSEETAELFLKNKNVIQRECLNNRENPIDLEKLTKHTLVMSNDVIVLGELKGTEANVFFDALSTGHTGFATVHAASSLSVIDRIITLIKKDVKAQYYTEVFLQKLLATSIDLIIYMKDFKIKEISKISYKDALKYEVVFTDD